MGKKGIMNEIEFVHPGASKEEHEPDQFKDGCTDPNTCEFACVGGSAKKSTAQGSKTR